jgi:hypothetical protein
MIVVSNPFTMVYAAIWRMIEDWPDLDELIKPGNRIKYDSPVVRSPFKEKISTADLPELALVADTVNCNTHQTCSTSRCTRRYSFMLSTGDYRYSALMAQLEWMLFATTHDWKSRLGKLVWPEGSDWHFCKRYDTPDASVGESNPDLNRNIRGWAAVWSFEVEMHFRRADILDLIAVGSSSGSQSFSL